MLLNTSIYIDIELLERLTIFSAALKIQLNSLITQILLKTAAHYKYNYRENRLIEYQENTGNQNFIPIHVKFTEMENEIFQEARFNYKISISKLLFLGFLLFFNEIAKKFKDKKNNNKRFFYSYHKYIKKFYFLIENFNISLKKRE
ncbi:MAG: hypothetical protein JW982_08890 [Spirochaetes bacterium]|nr:hypothetical protein [Spirochaetota bacterium]